TLFAASESKIIEPAFPIKIIPGFDVPGALIKGEAAIGLPVQLAAGAALSGTFKVDVAYQACTDVNCDRPKTVTLEVPYRLEPGEPRPDRLAAVVSVPDQPAGYVAPDPGAAEEGAGATDATKEQIEDAQASGLLPFLGLAFLMGLAALATPCVWPMIPITVSFFSKGAGEGKSNLKGALTYAIGIMGAFTLIGVGVSVLFGATGVQLLAANPWVNLGLAVLFIILALNLFGVFEIALPSSMINTLDSKGEKMGGLIGPILMGIAFALTSFTCTVPFAGTVLAAAATGDYFYPAVDRKST
ncbi:MAG: hypothetical protein MH204_10590, partial [Fimbriimonadaceae bacterium]|nr:hypothetical protein [Fimbriimonadaceae bacterium]